MTEFEPPIMDGRWSPNMGTILTQIAEERQRQHEQWGRQSHPDGTGEEYAVWADAAREVCDREHRAGTGTWAHILAEEFFEAMAEDDTEKLRKELIQVAAVAVSWVEDIDRR